MCIGLPMRVRSACDGVAVCEARGELRRVRTALLGSVKPGDFLLVLNEDARELLDPQRAAEIDAMLDLLQSAIRGADPGVQVSFALPSALSRGEIAAISGVDPEREQG